MSYNSEKVNYSTLRTFINVMGFIFFANYWLVGELGLLASALSALDIGIVLWVKVGVGFAVGGAEMVLFSGLFSWKTKRNVELTSIVHSDNLNQK